MGRKKSMGKKIFAAAVATGIAGGYTWLCNRLFDSTVARNGQWSYGGKKSEKSAAKGENKGETGAVPFARYGDVPAKAREWLVSQEQEELTIHSTVDETPLFARYLHCEEPKRIILCVHGYRGSSANSFAGIAQWLHENDSDLLLIDQRACGHSGGEYITFGAREKYDVLDWLELLEYNNRKGLPIYLYGVSMGAATVAMASGQTLPPNVRGMIVDCGFTSMKDTCSQCLKKWYHLPSFPVMQTFNYKCEAEAHFSIQEANAESALRKCRIPALFIHGTQDEFIPPAHAIRNYQACGSPEKDILWVAGAGHAVSMYEDPAAYREAMMRLFETCEK